MSWSIKILFLYLGFVAIILTLVFTCMRHKTDLEYADYYSRELSFQDQLAAEHNTNMLAEDIRYSIHGTAVTFSFPAAISQGLQGTIELLRPSDARRDVIAPVHPDSELRQTVGGLTAGVYKLRVRLKQGGTAYFRQAVINVGQ